MDHFYCSKMYKTDTSTRPSKWCNICLYVFGGRQKFPHCYNYGVNNLRGGMVQAPLDVAVQICFDTFGPQPPGGWPLEGGLRGELPQGRSTSRNIQYSSSFT
eukprot:TRINITY_DN3939_c0_g3_i1.p1 TRINITY_DN3939_c0_g3~~TRINITY_DN3939_c0_g3_i1.p1  ORF type:complete len:102 (+),score=11.35 TRINITY_DN3939_c0_g3_i1:147-452(+)